MPCSDEVAVERAARPRSVHSAARTKWKCRARKEWYPYERSVTWHATAELYRMRAALVKDNQAAARARVHERVPMLV